jgi:hypothetical protein
MVTSLCQMSIRESRPRELESNHDKIRFELMSSSSPPPDESTFSTLPASLRRRIDQAFDSVVNPLLPSRKKRKTRHDNATADGGFIAETSQPGGFISDDEIAPGGFLIDDTQPGGFTVDEHDSSPNTPKYQSYISLSSIPAALQLLDIQPDDPDILSVFKNAASGWKKSSNSSQSDEEQEEAVSKDDWRTVCAVLFEGSGGGDEGETGINEESEGVSDDEEYQDFEDDESEPSSDDGDDEYVVAGTSHPKSKSKPTRKSRRRATSSSPDSDSAKPLTARQTRECRVAFALFFPDTPDSALDKERIMIKDITRVAKVLKEKIKAEEVRLCVR